MGNGEGGCNSEFHTPPPPSPPLLTLTPVGGLALATIPYTEMVNGNSFYSIYASSTGYSQKHKTNNFILWSTWLVQLARSWYTSIKGPSTYPPPLHRETLHRRNFRPRNILYPRALHTSGSEIPRLEFRNSVVKWSLSVKLCSLKLKECEYCTYSIIYRIAKKLQCTTCREIKFYSWCKIPLQSSVAPYHFPE